ncbi:MAG: type II toxin-antitoxin system RelE/ParE family toxin [Candidatus Azobacteroides sp.]|nr:type II toxin-antitoxin system RelE/ParE family toxin [Candidatus Azobacteroides sp.]
MVKHTIRWSEHSKTDLKEIFEYIRNAESYERAKYVVSEIRNAVNKITPFPAKHTKEPIITAGNVRYVVKWSYKILFTIETKQINIIRIFHTAQNPDKLIC